MANVFPLSVVISAVDRLSGPLGKMGGKLGRFGAGATRAGRSLSMGLTLPMVLLGASTIATATDFESSMLTVQALTSASAKEFAELNAQARQLGKTTAFSAGQAGDAMGFLAQSGFKTNEILSATPHVLNLAAASGLEMGRSAEIASILLRGYGKEASELENVNNLLVATFSNSTQNLEQLFEAMKLAGPIASGMGFHMTETAAILGKFADSGFQASLGGTAFRGAMARLIGPAGDARAVFRRLQLGKGDFFDSEGRILSLRNAVLQLNKAGASAEDVFTIFGQRAGPAMVKLVGGGVEAIDELMATIDNAGDIAQRVADTKMSGFAGKMLLMVSAFKELQIVIAQSGFMDWLTGVVGGLTKFIQRAAEASPRTIKWGLAIVGVATALGPLLIVIGLVSSGVGALWSGLGILLPVLKFFGALLLRTVIPAVWSFTVALLANPIGAVVAGVIALIAAGVLLVKNYKAVGRFFWNLWSNIKTIVGGVLGWMLDKVGQVLSIFPDWMIALLGGGGSTASLLIRRDSLEQELSSGRVQTANANGAPGAGGTAHVRIDVNAPDGTRVESDPLGTADLELNLGLAMEGF